MSNPRKKKPETPTSDQTSSWNPTLQSGNSRRQFQLASLNSGERSSREGKNKEVQGVWLPVGVANEAVAMRGGEEVQGALERLERELLQRLGLHGLQELRASAPRCRHGAARCLWLWR